MATVLLGELTREQVRAVAPQTTLVIPVAAVEQHAPDLPITVDVLCCTEVARGAAAIAVEQTPILVAPIVPYGYSPHHLPYPGVFTLKAETLLAVLRELGESAVASGFRRIYFLNGHGGNDELIRLAAREVSNHQVCLTGAASYWSLAMAGLRAVCDPGLRIPGHAGDFEASLIMALRPELVDASASAPHKGLQDVALPDTTNPGFQQLNHSIQRIDGYTDRSPAASAELGRRLLPILHQEVAKALVRFHRALE